MYDVQDQTEVKRAQLTDGSMGFMAEDPDLPGCVGYGHTADEAEQRLEKARRAYLKVRGRPKPQPEISLQIGEWRISDGAEIDQARGETVG